MRRALAIVLAVVFLLGGALSAQAGLLFSALKQEDASYKAVRCGKYDVAPTVEFKNRLRQAVAADYGVPLASILLFYTADESLWGQLGDQVAVTVENDQITSITAAAASEVWLHVSVAGGDSEDIPGAPSNGSNPLQISATLRQSQDPASQIIPVSRYYRITIRTTDGLIYDVVKIGLASGVMAAVNYSGNGTPAVVEVLERDFETVEAGGNVYAVRLAAPIKMKFYKDL